MAKFPITTEQQQKLIDYLTEFIDLNTPKEREHFLDDTGLSEAIPNLLQNLEIVGTANTFCKNLIQELQRVGTLSKTNQPALVVVLEYLIKEVSGHKEVIDFVKSLLEAYSKSESGFQDASKSQIPKGNSQSYTLNPHLMYAFMVLIIIILSSITVIQLLQNNRRPEQSKGFAEVRNTPTSSSTATPSILLTATQNDSTAPIPNIHATAMVVVDTPSRLKIPIIGVNALIEPVGLDEAGAISLPQNPMSTAWWEAGTMPSDMGNAVIVGALEHQNEPAVFWDLKKLEVGDRVVVEYDFSDDKTFEVIDIGIYRFEDLSVSEKIYGATNSRNLNLTTSNGQWNDVTQRYENILVVYTQLIE